MNPRNVVRLLDEEFSLFESTKFHTIAEEELASYLKAIIEQAMEYEVLEVEVEYHLDLHDVDDESVKPVAVDDPDYCEETDEYVPPDEVHISIEKKKEIVEFWRSPVQSQSILKKKKGQRTLKSVQHNYRFVKSERQLYRWEKAVKDRGTRYEKLKKLSDNVFSRFLDAKKQRLPMHDMNLRLWAIQAARELGMATFKASRHWVANFKNRHNIVSRKITKVVSRRQIIDKDAIEESALNFVLEVQEKVPAYGPENIANTDQSGYEQEMHSGRTLEIRGTKTVEALAQSVNATTHSYTVQPTVKASGELIGPLLLCLQESAGGFGPRVKETMFKPDNLLILASKSGKLTNELVQVWKRSVLYPNTGDKLLLLIDSWGGYGSGQMLTDAPEGKHIEIMIIPKSTTGMIQPLDVYGNRPWKNFVRTFSDYIIINDIDFRLSQRDNIIRMVSLVFDQLQSPRFINMGRYSFYKSGYITERPPMFVTPVTIAFRNFEEVECDICAGPKMLNCCWCLRSLCFHHFVTEYHRCKEYVP